jgi:hypothetical protein
METKGVKDKSGKPIIIVNPIYGNFVVHPVIENYY